MSAVTLQIPAATHTYSGKVRDLYDLPDGSLLMVASDRISAFDFVLEPGIPDKGAVLTSLSLWWFDQVTDLVPHHVRSTDVPESVRGRAVVCERLQMFPVECVARGYLTGSGLSDYRRTGEVCGGRAAARPARRRPAAGADLHAGHQGGARRARRERLLRAGRRHRSAPTSPPGCAS
jgi:phosphoribosylaminoimidazole-succinocarboxamide synthase